MRDLAKDWSVLSELINDEYTPYSEIFDFTKGLLPEAVERAIAAEAELAGLKKSYEKLGNECNLLTAELVETNGRLLGRTAEEWRGMYDIAAERAENLNMKHRALMEAYIKLDKVVGAAKKVISAADNGDYEPLPLGIDDALEDLAGALQALESSCS